MIQPDYQSFGQKPKQNCQDTATIGKFYTKGYKGLLVTLNDTA